MYRAKHFSQLGRTLLYYLLRYDISSFNDLLHSSLLNGRWLLKTYKPHYNQFITLFVNKIKQSVSNLKRYATENILCV